MTHSNRHVSVLFNSDWEKTTEATNDVVAIRQSAVAVQEALSSYGFKTSLMDTDGTDLIDVIESIKKQNVDLVFNICESLATNSTNEFIVPALLDMYHIPYTGSDAMSLCLSLEKQRTKEILCANNIATPRYKVLNNASDANQWSYEFPAFVKLIHEDASLGISDKNIVHNNQELFEIAKTLIAEHKQAVIVETYIDGREINATVMGNGATAQVLPLREIDFDKLPKERPHIVSYAAKWDESHIDYLGTISIPLRDTSEMITSKIKHAALASYQALAIRDFGRVDMRIDNKGNPWVIDINPNCDISVGAGFALTAQSSGLDYPQLVGSICELAWKRYANQNYTSNT